MKYCTDTWFLLKAFDKDAKAVQIIEDTKQGKTQLVIPTVVFAETIKKLAQRRVSQETIFKFFSAVEQSEKVSLTILDRKIAKEASLISLSNKVPLIDAFVAASAKLSDCLVLLSGDDDYKLLVKKKYIKVQSW